MRIKRFPKALIFAAGLMFLFAVQGPARASSTPQSAIQSPAQISSGTQGAADPALNDDFAGLDLSDDQKAGIAKIHQNAQSQKAAVARTETLNSDQREAMILGYSRMEYGRIFRILTPFNNGWFAPGCRPVVQQFRRQTGTTKDKLDPARFRSFELIAELEQSSAPEKFTNSPRLPIGFRSRSFLREPFTLPPLCSYGSTCNACNMVCIVAQDGSISDESGSEIPWC